MKQLLLILCMLCLGLSDTLGANSKDNGGTIKGAVTDASGAAVPFANIILKSAADSILYKGEISNENGEFNFENVKEGQYFIEIRVIGSAPYSQAGLIITPENPIIDLGTIALQASSKDLKEVDIQVEKPFIEREVDKTVVNIENSIVQTGSSIIEVMEKLPGVIVDQDGKISLKGKQGVIVMIDGRPTGLSGQELANMLRGMPSANIQKIELITNPSAKYDAAGNAGIINIIMKKNRKQGLNGNVSAGYGQGRYAKYNGSLSLNYKDKWYNLFLNYSYSNRKGFNNLMLNRKFYEGDSLNTVFDTDNYIIFPFKTHNPRLGADFYLSKKTTLSLLGTSVVNEFSPSASNHTNIYGGSNNLLSSYDFINESNDRWYNYAANAELKHTFDTTGQELTLNLDYAKYWNNTDQRFITTYNNADGLFSSRDVLIGNQDGALELYSAKLDYSKPLNEKSRFEAGLKSSYVSSDNNMQFFNELDSATLFDSTRSSHFLYAENINAAYLNFNKEFEKFSFQLGLRTEHTTAKGEQVLTGQTFSRNYVQVFPTLFADYKISDKHGVNLSLGRRIDRPGYEQMNPFKRLIDATTYSEGNPYLLPQLTYNSELTYSYDNTFFITGTYSLTTDNITDVLIQDSASRTTVQTVVNLNRLNNYSINLSFSKKLTKWWTTNTSILSYYGVYTGTINNFQLNSGIPSFYFNSNNNFSIVDGLSAELTFYYNHRALYGVTTFHPNYNLTVGVQKSLLKKRGTITVNMSDIFWKAYPSGVTDFGNVNESWVSKRDTRVLNISFSYKFGKGKAGKIRKNTGADDEKSRISNG